MAFRYTPAVVFFLSVLAFGQSGTTINLASQTRNADFSNFSFTRPVTVGSTLPASCQLGQLYYNSSAAPGSNLYACTSANTWTLIAGYTLSPAGTGTLGGVFVPANSGLIVSNAGALSANVGTTSGTVAAGNDSRIVNALQPGSLVPATNITGLAPSATTDTTNAANIATGILANARLSSSVPLTSQANTYQPGAKQVFAASSGSAGEASAGVSSDPATLTGGDRWFRSDLKRLSFYDGVTAQRFAWQSDLGIAFQAGGIAQGTATTLNCSTNLNCVVSGGVATISASAATGGNAPGGLTNSIQYNASSSFAGVLNASNTKEFLTQASGAVPVFSTISASDVAGLASSATIDTTNASNIAAGTIAPAILPVSTFDAFFPMGACPASSTPALAWDAPVTGTAAIAAGCSGANVNQAYAGFANTGTPALLRTFTLPPSFAATNGADVYLTYITPTASATFTLALDVTCTPANGTATNDPAFTANNFFAPGSQTSPAAANQVQTISAANIPWPASCAANSLAHLRLIRTDTTGTASSVLITGLTLVGRRKL